MNRIHNLEIYKKLSAVNMYNKLERRKMYGKHLMSKKSILKRYGNLWIPQTKDGRSG